MTLQEIVARAIAGVWVDPKANDKSRSEAASLFANTALNTLAALRDPPPEVIEAGAKAMWNEQADEHNQWGALDQSERNGQMLIWPASWRAALEAGR